jgi:hypothetical protein
MQKDNSAAFATLFFSIVDVLQNRTVYTKKCTVFTKNQTVYTKKCTVFTKNRTVYTKKCTGSTNSKD